MNHPTDQWRKDNSAVKRKHRGIFLRLMARPFRFLGWIAVGIACLLLALLVFYPHRYATMSLLLGLKTGPKAFRTKIPEEIIIAQNIFRGKIPIAEQSIKSLTTIERILPIEQKAVPPQLMVASSEQKESKQEVELVRSKEDQIKTDTEPPVTSAAPLQPMVEVPEKRDSEQETEVARSVEVQKKIDTASLVPTAVPGQPADAPSAKSEQRQQIEPYAAIEPHTKIETTLPAEEQSKSSRQSVAPSEQSKLPDKADLRRSKLHPQPVQIVISDKTEERIIQSEKWLLSQESSYYTIQLMGARKEVLLFDFVERNQLLEQNEIAFYRTTFKDKPWFQLLYGLYTTKNDAYMAAENLPPKIRNSSPWIRRLSAVQKAIRAQTPP